MMDAVPFKFVDSVVELFSKTTLDQLAPEVAHPHWKRVVDLHHRNRVNYRLLLNKREDGIEHIFPRKDEGDDEDEDEEDFFVGTQMLKENRRFLRIVEVSDESNDGLFAFAQQTEKLEEAETVKLLETAAPLIDQVSGILQSEWGRPDCTEVLLTSLFKRVYLRKIVLVYCGQIAYDFLEDQIDNSPFLSSVDITGEDWPQSSLELLKNNCEVTDEEGLQALLDKGESKIAHSGRSQSFFKHETEKSLARVSDIDFNNLMECFTCECDRFEKCHMKEEFPEYHYLLNHTSAPKIPACQEATSPMGSQMLPTSRVLKDLFKNINGPQPSATCHSCSLSLPISQFFDCSKCSSHLGLPELLICGACAFLEHSDHRSEVAKACFIGAHEVEEATAQLGSPKQSWKDEEAEENEMTSKLANINSTIEAIKKSTLTRKALDEQIYKLKLLYEDMEECKEEDLE
uniref:C2H2-type domain-containing protein n=1 Tax=Steinernema glaseri TaxID=37863 RepID=A0A1I7ZPX7_9BILA